MADEDSYYRWIWLLQFLITGAEQLYFGKGLSKLRYKVEVNREGCIACAACYTLDPNHYTGDDAGKSQVIGGTSNGVSAGTFDDEKIEDAKSAAISCPVSVITVTEA